MTNDIADDNLRQAAHREAIRRFDAWLPGRPVPNPDSILQRLDRRVGVVLAAGAAERMPNKALLPIDEVFDEAGQRRTRIMIESALDFTRLDGIPPDRTWIVVADGQDLIRKVLQIRRPDCRYNYVTQPAYLGPADALSRTAPIIESDALVTFCDNWYDPRERVPSRDYGEAALVSIRHSSRTDLDAWDHRKNVWLDRNHGRPRHSTFKKLAGWMLVRTQGAASGLPNISLPALLNKAGAQACDVLSAFDWWDLGTPQAYGLFLAKLKAAQKDGHHV